MALPVLQRNAVDTESTEHDPRPRFGIGHMTLPARDVALLREFYTSVGMRLVVDMGQTAILELRGGTHLIVHQGAGGDTSLDLIVDDIDDTQAALAGAGAETSAISRGHPHDQFIAIDPEGNRLVVNSNHAMGPV